MERDYLILSMLFIVKIGAILRCRENEENLSNKKYN